MKQLISLCPILILVLPSRPAQATHPEAYLRFSLTEGSTYTQGCYDPCDCPISIPVPVTGFFELRPLESNPISTVFEVSSVLWTVSSGVGSFEVLGCGTYTVAGEVAVMQRLELDLVVEDSVMHFDSGSQPGGGNHEEMLDLTVSMNGMVCFDRVFKLHAKRAPADHVDFICSLEGKDAVARWRNERGDQLVRIDVSRDGDVIATVDPGTVEYREEARPGTHIYSAIGVVATAGAGVPGDDLFLGSCCAETPVGPQFHRGDVDGNGELEITDAIRSLGCLFLWVGACSSCVDAADADDNGELQLTDAVRILNVLFLGVGLIPLPGAPGEPCGPDPTEDALGCESYAPCQ